MIAPCDANQCVKMLDASLTYPGPIYIRIPRGEEPAVYKEDYEYVIGKAIDVKDGKDATIIATGSGVYNSLQAALQLQEKGLDVAVIDMHTIKPIDKEAIIKAAQTTGTIITVEDHNVLGGLGSIVADVLMEAGVPARLKKIGVQDEFISLGYPEEIYPYLGFDALGIAKTVEEFCKK
jgi:transketolase